MSARNSAAVVLLLAAQSAISGSITNSAHDLRREIGPDADICITCHTPHQTEIDASRAPLWNPANPVPAYALYGSSAMHAKRHLPGRNSKLCLSCHDGTLATDRSGAATGASMTPALRNLGNTLVNHHPVGFVYHRALVTPYGSLSDPGVKTVTIGLDEQSRTGTVAGVLLIDGKVECSSCHDVHNTFTVGTKALVRVTAGGRAICLACHEK